MDKSEKRGMGGRIEEGSRGEEVKEERKNNKAYLRGSITGVKSTRRELALRTLLPLHCAGFLRSLAPLLERP